MENWDEIRTAFQVARLGTVSGAAEVLGVHHATVIRHVDALERRLGGKLFQRHARGYTPTEAGLDLLMVAKTTEDQFNQLAGRIKGQGEEVSGDIVVTSLGGLARQIVPLLAQFQQAHPDVRVRFITSERLFRLEYGEAHVAIRAGTAPDQPDNVAQKLVEADVGAFASRAYVERHGIPKTAADYANHRFVGPENEESRAPYHIWMRKQVPQEAITFRCSNAHASLQAVSAGAGIGFVLMAEAAHAPDLVQVHAPRPEWRAPLWLVTHVDLHRTTKVQALLRFLKSDAVDAFK